GAGRGDGRDPAVPRGATMRWARRMGHLRGEDGQIMLLSIVYGLITLALVLVVASVSHLHIERKRLWSLADALAAGAADAADTGVWYETAGADGLVLTDASVSQVVGEQ